MSMGFAAEKSMTYGRGKSREAIDALSDVVGGVRAAKVSGVSPAPMAFSDQHRRDSLD